MDFSVAQLALVFTPGIIWANIDTKYGAGLKPKELTFLLRAFLFGMATYSILFLIYSICNYPFGYPELVNGVEKLNIIALADEIAWSVPLSLFLSVVWLFIVKYRLLMNISLVQRDGTVMKTFGAIP